MGMGKDMGMGMGKGICNGRGTGAGPGTGTCTDGCIMGFMGIWPGWAIDGCVRSEQEEGFGG